MYFSTGLIFLLIVLDILVYFLQIQQEEEDASSLDQRSVHEQDHGKRKDSPSLDKQCRVFSLSEIKLATHNFDDAFVIGKGGFGKVYKGKMDQEIEVAIKRLNLESNQGATEFWAEIEMLSKFRHSHIVSLLGYCQESGQGEMILVYEYMPNGSLDDHLHKRKTNCSPLTWVQRLHICIGAARGLDYLHTGTGVQSRVIHRDIKSSNILLAENWAGKLSDFGLSRISPAYQSGSTTNVYTNQLKGTFGYMDEEYYLTHRLTRKSDVYAFGVVLLEVLCGRRALDFSLDEEQHSLAIWAKDCIKEGKVDRIIDPNLRGQVEGKCLKEFGQIAYECVLSSSKDRATMTKVLARLEFVLARTLRIKQSAGDGRRTTFIDKAWSLLSTKPLKMGMSSDAMNLEQNVGDKKEGLMMEKHATTIAEGGCHDSGDSVQQVVPPRQQTTKIFTFSELKYATKKFSQSRVIGVGGFGTVYKGRLRSDGLAVAIKKLNPEGFQGFIEWQAEVSFLGNISHPNLVNLLGYCQADNQRLLVYEYMEKGSLEDHLFKNGANPLSWYTRIKIAMGAAQGLAFLHTTEVICRDMKPSNILLDGDFNVKLSDFALAKLGPVNGESHVTTRIMGTYGYGAPEYIAIGQAYVWSDVYGFGVLMLEMITGLRVLDTNRDALKQNLVDWSRPMLSDKKELQRIMDPRLEQDYPTEGATKAAELILSCLEPGPRNRPSMKEVVAGLQGISAIRIKPNMSMSK